MIEGAQQGGMIVVEETLESSVGVRNRDSFGGSEVAPCDLRTAKTLFARQLSSGGCRYSVNFPVLAG
jgi:hypothetical protein